MNIRKIKNRSVLFTFYNSPEWDLNIHLIMAEKYNYLIDTGLGSLTVKPVQEYIGNNAKPLIVINTHYHWDHIWGNGSFEDCPIISHKMCRDFIESKWEAMLEENKGYMDGEVKKCPPNLVFEKELYFAEDGIRVIYTPGHTPDCISVIDEVEKVINVGDNIGDSADEMVPELDCERSVYLDTLEKYREMDFDTCISGHNTVLGKDAINQILKRI